MGDEVVGKLVMVLTAAGLEEGGEAEGNVAGLAAPVVFATDEGCGKL